MYCVRVRILVAEDERINQLYLSHLLTTAGHEVALAGDGFRVLELLREQAYDLILMDVRMPGMDGIEATRRIRAGEAGAERARVPIVALTAYARADDQAQYREAGVTRVATKPLDQGMLMQLVEETGTAGDGAPGESGSGENRR